MKYIDIFLPSLPWLVDSFVTTVDLLPATEIDTIHIIHWVKSQQLLKLSIAVLQNRNILFDSKHISRVSGMYSCVSQFPVFTKTKTLEVWYSNVSLFMVTNSLSTFYNE